MLTREEEVQVVQHRFEGAPGGRLSPEPWAEIGIKTDLHAVFAGQLDRVQSGIGQRPRHRQRNPGEMQESSLPNQIPWHVFRTQS